MLIVSFSVNFAGIIAGFIVLRLKIRQEMKSLIFESLKESDFEIVKIPSNLAQSPNRYFKLNNSHEFRFMGKLYDFSHFKYNKNEVWFYAVNDSKEESLIENFASCLNDKLSDRTAAAKFAFNQLLQTITSDFILQKFENIGFFCESSFTFVKYALHYKSIILSIISPPPDSLK